MDPVRNPYTPGAGSRPPVLSGRDGQLEAFRVLLERLRLGRPEKSMLITGLRGVGKTVLLTTFEAIAEDAGYKTASTEVTHDTNFALLMARLTRRLLLALSPLERMKRKALSAAGVLKAFTVRFPEGPEIGIDVAVLAGRGDSGDLGEDLGDLLVALGEAAREHDTGIAFLLDEVQFLERPELEALIAALHRVAQRGLPLTLVGAGLPQLPVLAGTAKSYSERLFDFPRIGRLDDAAARNALELPAQDEGVTWEPGAIEEVLRFTEGFPYFLQEYGKHAWNLADGDVITAADIAGAAPLVRLQLDENFFRVRVGRVTSAELRYISAMADLGAGPYRTGAIATKLGAAGPERVAPLRARLIAKGVIFSPEHGLNEFTVPQFDDYMRRVFPLSQL
ncbi:MAG: ATP-binding protein [Actinomycetota bacterium]